MQRWGQWWAQRSGQQIAEKLRSLTAIALAGVLWLSLSLGVSLGLTGCNLPATGPSRALITQALELELRQTQQELSQQLHLGTLRQVQIQNLKITQQRPIHIDLLPGTQIQGFYDFRAELEPPDGSETGRSRPVHRTHNPFTLFLQRQQEGKTWRLARLQTQQGQPSWVTQRLPLLGETPS